LAAADAAGRREAHMAPQKARLRYHCVEIIAGPGGCKAAMELANQRLLSADAPRLPLATCDNPAQCDCRYRHHDDRRAGPRRAAETGSRVGIWAQTNRRKARGRRDADFE
jgi:hypothetical protein